MAACCGNKGGSGFGSDFGCGSLPQDAVRHLLRLCGRLGGHGVEMAPPAGGVE